jgi:hypothetical protein
MNNHTKIFHRIYGMARPQVADGGDGLQAWRAAAYGWNKQATRESLEALNRPAWG